jgi:hypothetical protein
MFNSLEMAVVARNIVGLKTCMLSRFEYHLSLDGKYGKRPSNFL